MSAVLAEQREPRNGAESVTGIEVTATLPGQETLLTAVALDFLAGLHRRFEATRQAHLAARRERQAFFDAISQLREGKHVGSFRVSFRDGTDSSPVPTLKG